jgi:hypothetical protein
MRSRRPDLPEVSSELQLPFEPLHLHVC